MNSHLAALKGIYDAMDRAYTHLVGLYGFGCTGCRENCCTTLFHHYTLAESLYLLKGFSLLSKQEQLETADRAKRMCDPQKREGYLCPLNVRERCILYPFRTMICRLHGVPYELVRPDGKRENGPGCPRFEEGRISKGLHCRRIDRTPFYRCLAELEMELRGSIRSVRKFKMTIAEILEHRESLKDVMNSQ